MHELESRAQRFLEDWYMLRTRLETVGHEHQLDLIYREQLDTIETGVLTAAQLACTLGQVIAWQQEDLEVQGDLQDSAPLVHPGRPSRLRLRLARDTANNIILDADAPWGSSDEE